VARERATETGRAKRGGSVIAPSPGFGSLEDAYSAVLFVREPTERDLAARRTVLPMDDMASQRQEFQSALDALAAAVRRGRRSSARDVGTQMTAAQVEVLASLADAQDGIAVAQLARRAGLSGQTVARVLHELREREFIEERRPSSDARFVLVQLTERGREVLAAHLDVLSLRQRAAFDAFTAEERDILVSGLRRVTEIIRASSQ
jgi:DNA-binding MarR family transcriptional regulator